MFASIFCKSVLYCCTSESFLCVFTWFNFLNQLNRPTLRLCTLSAMQDIKLFMHLLTIVNNCYNLKFIIVLNLRNIIVSHSSAKLSFCSMWRYFYSYILSTILFCFCIFRFCFKFFSVFFILCFYLLPDIIPSLNAFSSLFSFAFHLLITCHLSLPLLY